MPYLAVATAPKRDSRHWTNETVSWGDVVAAAQDPADRKDCGNWLFGTLRESIREHDGEPCTALHRTKAAVVSRSAVTLDVDHATPGWIDGLDLLLDFRALVHSTYSSTPAEPRYRLIVPLSREVAPDEYIAAARAMMRLLGESVFDPSTDQPERYMFRPGTADRSAYEAREIEGPTVDVDRFLAEFPADLREKSAPAPSRTKRNPFEIDGTVGAFNRAYEDWDLLIEEYGLPYEKVSEDRYHLVGAASQAGMGPVNGAPGLVFSHHSNDPAGGRACSAFDLVRLHRFGDLDEGVKEGTPVNRLPSHEAMLRTATEDRFVVREILGETFSAELEDIEAEEVEAESDWRVRLDLDPKSGNVRDVVSNWDLIAKHDPVFSLLYFDEMTLSPSFAQSPPWRKVEPMFPGLTEADYVQIWNHVERTYRFRPARNILDSQVLVAATRNSVHPVRAYLDTLKWDGQERLETCLPGVKPTDFTRMTARKILVAAVARVFEPGVKADHTLVLYGSEGLGKSFWINRMSRGWTAPLGPIDSKDSILAARRSWIVTSDEGHSMRKAEWDALKDFLTRTSDVVRLPYERASVEYPRQFVVWSTTNDDTFLRNQEGNRRFLIVHCEETVDFDRFTPEYVDQVWAEAVALYRAGEPLHLSEEEAAAAKVERERFTEEEPLVGIITEYLDRRVPESYASWSPEQRVDWIRSRDSGIVEEGDYQIDVVCSAQIWVEALGRRAGDFKRLDSLAITNALKALPNWVQEPGRRRLPGYGPQVLYRRKS